MQVLLVKHIFVQQEGHQLVVHIVPNSRGEGFGHKAPQHERAGFESGKAFLDTNARYLLKKMNLPFVAQEVEHARLVLMRTHLAFQHLLHILVGIMLIPIVHNTHGHFGFVL